MKMRTTLKQRLSQRRPEEFGYVPFFAAEDRFQSAAPLLAGKCVLVTGGDSTLGRAVALACAQEGADVALAYCHEDKAAGEIREEIHALGRRGVLLGGRMDDPRFCRNVVAQAVKELGTLHVLMNNILNEPTAEDQGSGAKAAFSPAFHTDVFSMFYVTRAAIPHLRPGSAIINTAVYSIDPGKSRLHHLPPAGEAIAAYTRSLARGLAGKKIRVNAMAVDPDQVLCVSAEHEPLSPTGRLVVPCYVFLASEEASELTGQVLSPEADTLNFNLRFP